MNNIEIQLNVDVDVPQPLLIQAAQCVLTQQDTQGALSIVITDDAQLETLNQQYRGISAPTDILSFPSDPLPFIPAEERYLGDIIVSLPYVMRRVADVAHTLDDELALLIVHGTLHLLGFDHDTHEKQQLMWAHQADALKTLNIDLVVPDYIHNE